MNMLTNDKPALLLVDIQKGFDEIDHWGGQRNNLNAEDNAAELLDLWRTKRLPLFHIMHCSTNPASPLHKTNPGNAFKELVKPLKGEPIIKKIVNSAFIGTRLEAQLRKANIKQLVIVGLTTDHCISTTTRMAGNLGFDSFLVADATATFNKKGSAGQNYPAELMHETAIASLNTEFATIVNTNEVKQKLLDNSFW